MQVEQVLREVDGAADRPATKGEDAAAGLDAPVEKSEGDILPQVVGRYGEIRGDIGEMWGDMVSLDEPVEERAR